MVSILRDRSQYIYIYNILYILLLWTEILYACIDNSVPSCNKKGKLLYSSPPSPSPLPNTVDVDTQSLHVCCQKSQLIHTHTHTHSGGSRLQLRGGSAIVMSAKKLRPRPVSIVLERDFLLYLSIDLFSVNIYVKAC